MNDFYTWFFSIFGAIGVLFTIYDFFKGNSLPIIDLKMEIADNKSEYEKISNPSIKVHNKDNQSIKLLWLEENFFQSHLGKEIISTYSVPGQPKQYDYEYSLVSRITRRDCILSKNKAVILDLKENKNLLATYGRDGTSFVATFKCMSDGRYFEYHLLKQDEQWEDYLKKVPRISYYFKNLFRYCKILKNKKIEIRIVDKI